jgi:hypothetical protein
LYLSDGWLASFDVGGSWCSLRKNIFLSFRSQFYRRGIWLSPAAKQQIPRATIPRFGMTNPLGIFQTVPLPDDGQLQSQWRQTIFAGESPAAT